MLVRRRLLPVPALSACAFLLALAALAAPAVAQASLTWSTTRTPVETGAGLSAIACPGAGLCVAGGPGDRLAISTDPAGGAWSAFTVAAGAPGAIADISCATTALCVAVDSNGNVLSSTDPAGGAAAWHAAHFTRPSSVAPMSFSSVSCPSETFCVAVDTADNGLLSTTSPTASQGAWKLDQLSYTPRQVSCTTLVCVAVTGSYVFTTRAAGTGGGAWTRTTLEGGESFDAHGRPASISCTALVCVAGGDGGVNGTEAFSSTSPDGGAAAWKHVPLSGSNLDDANCVSAAAATLCTLSSDFGGFVFDSVEPTGAAGAWALSPAVGGPEADPDHVADVACATTSSCVAVTEDGYAVVGSGVAGPPPTPPSQAPETPAETGTSGSPAAPSGGGPSAPGNALPDAPGPFTGAHFPAGTTTISHTGNAVSFLLESSVAVTGTLSGTTAGSYALDRATGSRAARRRLSLGRVKFALVENKPKKVTLKLPRKVRALLEARASVPVIFTLTSADAAGHKSTTSRRYALTGR
jgi:hypothetical protein